MSRRFESGCRHKALSLPAGLTSHPPMGFDPHLIGKYGAVALIPERRGFVSFFFLWFNHNRADVPQYSCGANSPHAREMFLRLTGRHGTTAHGGRRVSHLSIPSKRVQPLLVPLYTLH